MVCEAIVAGGTVVVSVTAVIALYVEARRASFQRGVELLLRFNDDFFVGDPMRKARQRAAEGIKQKKYEETDDVLDFFETIGFLVRRRAISKLFVWHSFFHWIHRYRLLTKEYVASCRVKDATWWEDFVWLHDRLIRVEKKRRGCPDADIAVDSEEFADFIEDESKVFGISGDSTLNPPAK
jgi:hypothetical protein